MHLHGSTKLVAPSRFAADVTPAGAGLASQGNGCEFRQSETHKPGTVTMNIDITALLVKISKHIHHHHHHPRNHQEYDLNLSDHHVTTITTTTITTILML